MNRIIMNFMKYRFLLNELVVKDIKVKYRRSILGITWSLLNPLLMMIIMNIVFSNLFRIQIKNFMVYFLSGQILFAFFSEATTFCMGSIVANANLIKKVYIPKYIFPLSKVLSSFVNLLFSLVAVLIMVLVTHVKFTLTFLLFPIPIIYLFVFSLGLGLIFSVINVFFRDMNHIYSILMLAWMYLTPIIYPVNIIPAKYALFLKLNPIYYYVKYFRDLIMYNTVPDINFNLICIFFSLASLGVGFFIFYKKQDDFLLYI